MRTTPGRRPHVPLRRLPRRVSTRSLRASRPDRSPTTSPSWHARGPRASGSPSRPSTATSTPPATRKRLSRYNPFPSPSCTGMPCAGSAWSACSQSRRRADGGGLQLHRARPEEQPAVQPDGSTQGRSPSPRSWTCHAGGADRGDAPVRSRNSRPTPRNRRARVPFRAGNRPPQPGDRLSHAQHRDAGARPRGRCWEIYFSPMRGARHLLRPRRHGRRAPNNGVHPPTGAEVAASRKRARRVDPHAELRNVRLRRRMVLRGGAAGQVGCLGRRASAVLPGSFSIAVWSPPLDEIGNSIRGVAACRRISEDFGLHMFMNAAIRRRRGAPRDACQPGFPRCGIRNPASTTSSPRRATRSAVVELQAHSNFRLGRAARGANVERIRPGESVLPHNSNFRRLHAVDACRRAVPRRDGAQDPGARDRDRLRRGRHTRHRRARHRSGPDRRASPARARGNRRATSNSPDSALEHFPRRQPGRLRREPLVYATATRSALRRRIDTLRGASIETAGLKLLGKRDPVDACSNGRRRRSFRKWAIPARLFFVRSQRGSVMAWGAPLTEARPRLRHRNAIGPGSSFGEKWPAGRQAEPRSADVIATTRVILYAARGGPACRDGHRNTHRDRRQPPQESWRANLSARLRRRNKCRDQRRCSTRPPGRVQPGRRPLQCAWVTDAADAPNGTAGGPRC